MLIDRDGRPVARRSSAPGISGGWAELVAPVLEAGERVVSALHAPSAGIRYVTVAYPVRDASGTFVGVLTCYVNLERIEDALGAMLLSSSVAVTLSEAAGRVLASRPDPEQYADRLLETSWDGVSVRAPEQRDGIDGVRRMYGEAIVAGGPWLVTVGIPMSLASDRAMSLWAQSFMILAIGLGG